MSKQRKNFSFYKKKALASIFLESTENLYFACPFCTGVTDGSRQLADIADDLEAVKAEMDERGSSMTDGTPLVNIRKSLARMKQEVVTMDVRVGVVQHTLLQAKLKDKSNMQRDAYNWNSASQDNAYYH